MKHNKRSIVILCFMFLVVFGLARSEVHAAVEWNIQSTLNMEQKPLDVTSSADGKWVYILTPGEVLLYSPVRKAVIDRIPVDKGVDKITVSPKGDKLFVTNVKGKTLSVINVKILYQIDVKGSPFKGPANAPIVIAVFEDFQ